MIMAGPPFHVSTRPVLLESGVATVVTIDVRNIFGRPPVQFVMDVSHASELSDELAAVVAGLSARSA